MRFIKQRGQWALQFTLDWEVDALAKLPEDKWYPITYVGDSRIIGAIQIGTLRVRFVDDAIFQQGRPFTLLCPICPSTFPAVRTRERDVVSALTKK